uniref:Uncharacterized protein n=1 Tax=Globisporangium ultimum (strain ATCC 200006 / CBS 805.95 / DAOM BR144) TaxID=431595 RepID=K3XA72_GLOUD
MVGGATSDDWNFPQVDGYESTDDDERCQLLASISELISRMLEAQEDDDDNQDDDISNNSPGHDDNESAVKAEPASTDAQGSQNSTTRELVLQRTLSQALLELTSEQDNVRLAANAGNALLDQLDDARAETHVVLDQLHKCQQELEAAQVERRRLDQQCDAMERELMQFHAAQCSTEREAPCRANGVLNERESSKNCQHTAVNWNAIVEENNEFKRRCLELENQQTKERSAFRKLQHERLHGQTKLDHLLIKHGRANEDVVFLTAQITHLQADHNDAIAARDNLRVTARRLESDNSALVQKLEDRDALIDSLYNERRAASTAAQVLENRVVRLEAETQTLAKALAASKKQWETHKCPNDDSSEENVRLQQYTRDLEQLLEEAQHALAELKMENRVLRRHNKSPTGPAQVVEQYVRRRKSMTTTTCADLLAADKAYRSRQNQQQQRERAKTYDGVERTADKTFQQEQDRESHGVQGMVAKQTEPPLDQNVPQSDTDSSDSQTEDLAAPMGTTQHNTSNPTFLHQVAARRRRRYTYTAMRPTADPIQSAHAGERMRRSTITDASVLESSSLAEAVGGTPTAPLYFGLSFIACATAAGILSRR